MRLAYRRQAEAQPYITSAAHPQGKDRTALYAGRAKKW
jgi:hypothetical protein